MPSDEALLVFELVIRSGFVSVSVSKGLQLLTTELCRECRESIPTHVRLTGQEQGSLWESILLPKRSIVGLTVSTWQVDAYDWQKWKGWPDGVRRLEICGYFASGKGTVRFPEGLTTISFKNGIFGKPLEFVYWPKSLRKLELHGDFDQRIVGESLPPWLQSLSFKNSPFDCAIDLVIWPPTLKELVFGTLFNQPIEEIVWPSSLERLEFGRWFSHPIADVDWPESLRYLRFGEQFRQETKDVEWPKQLEQLFFSDRFEPSLNTKWPAKLTCLVFRDFRMIDGVVDVV